MKKNYLNSINSVLITILSFVVFILGCNVGLDPKIENASVVPATTTETDNQSPPINVEGVPEELAAVWETYLILISEYIDQENIDTEQLTEAAIIAMLQSLNDKYTSYVGPETFSIERQSFQGNFEGIGAQVEMSPDGKTVMITSPLPGGPAIKAGIKAGDKILAVDGESAIGWSVLDAVNRIRGPKGTSVTLTVEQIGNINPVDITIIRATIEQASVRFRRLNVEDGPYAVVDINQFTAETAQELRDGIPKLLDDGVPGLIIDLRGNPGGLLSATVDVASEFLTSGLVTYQVDGRGVREEWAVRPGGKFSSIPLVVLVNEFSASGSEVLAGALQDHGRSLIIGTKTFGKGSVNMLRQLSNGGGIYLTIGRWFTPNGKLIEGEGIIPDVSIHSPIGNQLTLTEDTQMSAAIKQLDFQLNRPK